MSDIRIAWSSFAHPASSMSNKSLDFIDILNVVKSSPKVSEVKRLSPCDIGLRKADWNNWSHFLVLASSKSDIALFEKVAEKQLNTELILAVHDLSLLEPSEAYTGTHILIPGQCSEEIQEALNGFSATLYKTDFVSNESLTKFAENKSSFQNIPEEYDLAILDLVADKNALFTDLARKLITPRLQKSAQELNEIPLIVCSSLGFASVTSALPETTLVFGHTLDKRPEILIPNARKVIVPSYSLQIHRWYSIAKYFGREVEMSYNWDDYRVDYSLEGVFNSILK